MFASQAGAVLCVHSKSAAMVHIHTTLVLVCPPSFRCAFTWHHLPSSRFGHASMMPQVLLSVERWEWLFFKYYIAVRVATVFQGPFLVRLVQVGVEHTKTRKRQSQNHTLQFVGTGRSVTTPLGLLLLLVLLWDLLPVQEQKRCKSWLYCFSNMLWVPQRGRAFGMAGVNTHNSKLWLCIWKCWQVRILNTSKVSFCILNDLATLT